MVKEKCQKQQLKFVVRVVRTTTCRVVEFPAGFASHIFVPYRTVQIRIFWPKMDRMRVKTKWRHDLLKD